MTREEAIKIINCYDIGFYDLSGAKIPADKLADAFDMAIEALSKPNYETDTEVRLAVTNRKKEKVILWDAFGEVEYYPNGEINCVNCPHYHETEDETGVHGHCGSHGRLIDADALIKAFEGCMPLSEDTIIRTIRTAPTVPVVDITQRDLCEDISCTDCPFMKETCKLMDYVAYADRPHGEWRTGKPTENGEYMVTLDAWGHRYINVMHYAKPQMPNREVDGTCWYRYDDEWGDVVYDDSDIVAWMPLPDPYKGE